MGCCFSSKALTSNIRGSGSETESVNITVFNSQNLLQNYPLDHLPFSVSPQKMNTKEKCSFLYKLDIIKSLPFCFCEEKEQETECSLCMCSFTKNENIRFLPCFHSFHTECIDSWLIKELKCPICATGVDI